MASSTSSAERQQLGRRRGDAGGRARRSRRWPRGRGRPRAEASTIDRPRPAGQQPVADVAGHRAAQPRPAGPPATAVARGPRARPASDHRDERHRDQRHRRPHGRRQREQHGDGEDDLHDLPGGALPRRRPAAPRPTSRTSRPWLTPRWTSPTTPPGSVEVEELRAVVRRDGGGQRQADAEAARHDRPPPGAADGRQHADGRRGRQRRAVDRADAVEERARAQRARRRRRASRRRPQRRAHAHTAPAHRCSRSARRSSLRSRQPSTGTRERAKRFARRHGSTSRSAWSTVTARCPGSGLRQTSAGVRARPSAASSGSCSHAAPTQPVEPLRRQLGLGGAEPPGARPDEDLGPRRAEPLDGGRDGVRAEQAAAHRRAPLVGVEGGRHAGVERIRRGQLDLTDDGQRQQHRAPAPPQTATRPGQLVRRSAGRAAPRR